ncbi:hypothetical protein L6164_020657 [Bauhinia variegata]|uniref:Uncharacterized protein n=1 Tax=Bauhinia variegata TaxID=167791 RepID=A0ACB9MZ82_BAUVA|nr:hypothetical protein L6164_020657 [Bauhinia variegata]
MHAVTGAYGKPIFVDKLGASLDSISNGVPLEDFGHGHPDPNLTYPKDLVDIMYGENGPNFGAASDANAGEAIPYFRNSVKGLAQSMPTSGALDRVAEKLNLPFFEGCISLAFYSCTSQQRQETRGEADLFLVIFIRNVYLKTQYEEGLPAFLTISINLASCALNCFYNMTIMALWRTRLLALEHKAQIAELPNKIRSVMEKCGFCCVIRCCLQDNNGLMENKTVNPEQKAQIAELPIKISKIKLADIPDVNLLQFGITKYGRFSVEVIDPVSDYLELLEMVFDFPLMQNLLTRPDFRFIFDTTHAVAGAYGTPVFVDKLGTSLDSISNGVPLEDFGHGHPDPNLTYAKDLVDIMYGENGLDFGATSDGDGDRNMILGKSFFVAPSDSVAIIAANAGEAIPYFMNSVMGLTRSMPTSGALDRVAEKLNLSFEVPTGWKFFGNLMDGGKLSIYGEESFGTGFDYICEKDGIWAVLAWLSILAQANKSKKPEEKLNSVSDIVKKHWGTYGTNFFSRYGYEECESEGANKMVEYLRAFFSKSKPGDKFGRWKCGIKIRELALQSGTVFIFDAMHAVTGAYAKPIFVDKLGASLDSISNGVPLEDFGHGHPDPNLIYAKDLVDIMSSVKGLARSMPTSGALDRVAEKLNLPSFEAVLAWLSILAQANKGKKPEEKLISVSDIVKKHWGTYRRNFFSRYNYEVSIDAAVLVIFIRNVNLKMDQELYSAYW